MEIMKKISIQMIIDIIGREKFAGILSLVLFEIKESITNIVKDILNSYFADEGEFTIESRVNNDNHIVFGLPTKMVHEVVNSCGDSFLDGFIREGEDYYLERVGGIFGYLVGVKISERAEEISNYYELDLGEVKRILKVINKVLFLYIPEKFDTELLYQKVGAEVFRSIVLKSNTL